jgi:hypothetical protein
MPDKQIDAAVPAACVAQEARDLARDVDKPFAARRHG